jgi:high-affinity iron transporter
MVGSSLILLREGLEGALIVAIVLAYLRKLDRRDRFPVVWGGTAIAAGIAIAVGTILFVTIGELSGDAEKIVEGSIMAGAAAVLTWMIFWMRQQARAMKGDLQRRVDTALLSGSMLALAGVVFFGVMREGIETVLFFLAAAGQSSTLDSLVGGALGLAAAVVLAYAFYRGSGWLNLRQFFTISGALVLLFASGLVAHALGEFQEVGILPTLWDPVYDVTSVSFLTEGHFTGQLLHGLFGWEPAPSIEQLVAWVAYVSIVGTLYFRGLVSLPSRRPERSSTLPAGAEPAEQSAGR